MTEPTRLCCDCKYYKKDWIEHLTGGGDRYDKCLNPVLTGNLVTGKIKGGSFCYSMRNYSIKCGNEGKYFEARK